MKQNIYYGRPLRKLNISFTLLIILANIIAFIISSANKNTAVSLNIFFGCLIFFLYRFNLLNLINRSWLSLKKEILYTNYPITIGIFFLLIGAIFCFDIYSLSRINQDALNLTFIFALFLSTLSMIFPSLLLLVYMYLLCPAFVIPSYETKKSKRKTDILILILFIIFILFSGYQIAVNTINTLTIANREKFKAVKLPVKYPVKYLKYTDLSDSTKEVLQKQDVKIPFLYTAEGFKFKDYESAEKFCKSLNAEVAGHLEIYNIIFNRFDTYGENYYWTKDKAGKNNLLLHFKNMSYEIVKNPGNITPIVYCTSEAGPNLNMFDQTYFFRVKPVEIETKKIKIDIPKKGEINSKQTEEQQNPQTRDIVSEDTVKHVNFNVRHVDINYFNELINQGYYYEKDLKVNSYYESNDFDLDSRINRDADMKNIRLCYYPFTDYKDMQIINQAQIWQQSFCSPSFDIIKPVPELKSTHQKDAYCYANGGRVPNIPELMAILKTFNSAVNGTKYWTNNKITSYGSSSQLPVAITVTTPGAVTAEAVSSSSEQAYTFCVKDSEKRSRIIANFKSRYKDLNGQYYAKKLCPSCRYYEVPDTVLLSN